MLKRLFVHFLVKKLLKAVIEEDVLRFDKKRGKIMCRGKALTKEQEEAIQMEAEILSKSTTLKLLLDDLRFLANQTMFDKSTKFDDMLFGKAMLYCIDLLQKKIDNLAK